MKIQGGLHVHVGYTCYESGGRYNDNAVSDPWPIYQYTTDELGRAVGTFVVDAGISVEQTVQRTIVVYDNSGTRVGCGVLEASGFSIASVHPAVVEHRDWLIFAFSIVVLAFVLQLGQLIILKVYESDDFSGNGHVKESMGHKIVTMVLIGMFVLFHFLMGESSYHSMHQYGDAAKGEWSVLFLTIATCSLMYGFIIQRGWFKVSFFSHFQNSVFE